MSEIFQQRNSRKDIPGAIEDLKRVKAYCFRPQCGISRIPQHAFGNPYGEAYNVDMVFERLYQAVECGADIVSLSDTSGQGTIEKVGALSALMNTESKVPWGAHMHSIYGEAAAKAQEAIKHGCTRIDTALRGFGGCPFASDALIGNMPTEKVLSVITAGGFECSVDPLQLESSYNNALKLFGRYL